jgi:alpha-galactosidase/6-phospho-beta-glucosidase family protein
MTLKIAFIGSGSVQWTLKLATDMILNETLADAELVLYDIDADALDLLARACQRVVQQARGSMRITQTLDRLMALRDADFVILCVGIGMLPAMRNDLLIPERYGIYQSVGDTVGPGGLARALRHIPFAVQVAREMEQVCPRAWLLNLTNPMTTICRGVTRATSIRTIGLCHEVTHALPRLAALVGLSDVPITFGVAGINHLPVILRFNLGGRDGIALLREWLTRHRPADAITQTTLTTVRDVFKDQLALKLFLLDQLGVLFGAGDRHVAEFLPGFLTPATQYGLAYGIFLTRIEHREEVFRWRRAQIEQFVAGAKVALEPSNEQLAKVMAALAGGPAGRFIVNIPNQGQIDNLPREAIVECMARVDALGVHPEATGALPHAAYAVVAPHVARQELIVEAALTGSKKAALAALATDPLVCDPSIVAPMLDALIAANEPFTSQRYA